MEKLKKLFQKLPELLKQLKNRILPLMGKVVDLIEVKGLEEFCIDAVYSFVVVVFTAICVYVLYLCGEFIIFWR